MCGIFFAENCSSEYPNIQLEHRGNHTITEKINGHLFVFNRLRINGILDTRLIKSIDQSVTILVNGEIFNYDKFIGTSRTSDCDSVLSCYLSLRTMKTRQIVKELMELLDGDYAIIIYDSLMNRIIYFRDPLGVRPLFKGYLFNNVYLASEAKVLENIQGVSRIHPVKPVFYPYVNVGPSTLHTEKIQYYLMNAVRKRLNILDTGYSFLLSGGLDSSLVVGIARKILGPNVPIKTFSIKTEKETTNDEKYALMVSKHCNTEHITVYISPEELFGYITETIYYTETTDITTIRASTPMYYLCKFIKTAFPGNSVLFSGEGSDELFCGYRYFLNYKKSDKKFPCKTESYRLLSELYHYDVLRADRTVAANTMELRVPFLDKELVKYVLTSVPEELIRPQNGVEKWLLRESFKSTGVIPHEVLMRTKDAFSDSVGNNWIDYIKSHVNDESGYYRNTYKNFYSKYSCWSSKWLPRWSSATDPSARLEGLI